MGKGEAMGEESRRRIVVVGCGASGMMAAIAAAKAGAAVTVLEGQKAPGRKLLMTGNSRCNLTNTAPRMAMAYQSGDEEMVLPLASKVLSAFPVQDTLDFFHGMGLLTTVEHGTYVYPVTGQSQSVLDILLEQMRELGVKTKFSEKVTSIEKNESAGRQHGSAWLVKTATWQYPADAVILACGSRAVPKTGSDGSGYEIARRLGLQVTEVVPALTGISVELTEAEHSGSSGKKTSFLSSLAGVRMNAGVSVWADGIPAARDIGQLQFTATDLSGIVVFQVSSRVSRALKEGREVQIRLDLIPAFTDDEIETLLRRYGENHPDAPAAMALTGLLPKQLVPLVLQTAGAGDLSKKKASDMDKMQIREIASVIKCFRLKATGVRGFDSCQVCAGGVGIGQVDPASMECKDPSLSGIYLTGEILDIDGPCGGYNLQWAWSSGYVAGSCAAAGVK